MEGKRGDGLHLHPSRRRMRETEVEGELCLSLWFICVLFVISLALDRLKALLFRYQKGMVGRL